ncbi:GldG family protein [Halomicroarcula sp. F28]|uniref:GldG family protein n=1 Tax=Haloarcula salinisoli TaxID=2487746 RepID=UPI001C7356D0|nr:GldG family protein [Halomicroarcula salinisoli]MBX0287661.1 GldG family protein [Halomicroarcula salinisoli]
MSNVAKRVGVFLVALVLAVGIGSVALGAGGGSAPAVNDANASAFNTGDAVADVPDESGEISMSEDAEGQVVVIDTTRSSSVTPETVTPMTNALIESGASVRYSSGGSGYGASLNSTLSEADAYIVFGASRPFTESDAAGLREFTDAGGRVVLMNEPRQQVPLGLFGSSSSFGAPSPNPLLSVSSEYGVTYENGYLYNMDDNANNYRNVYATPSGNSELTEGVDRVVLHESVAVSGGETRLTATEGTTLSTTRESDTYGVLAQEGNFVTVGDASIFDQEYLYHADNEVLVSNLLDFLVSGDKSPEDAPGGGGFGGGGGSFGGGSDGGFGGGDGGEEPTRTPVAP